jgi:D-alanyl-D-alanine carboxypeptidase
VILQAAARYPAIARITSQRSQAVLVGGRPRLVRNTNALVGTPSWHVLVSKTGFTNDAGRCLGMRTESAGRTVTIVLLGAARRSQRTRDAQAIQRWLGVESAGRREARRSGVQAAAPGALVVAPDELSNSGPVVEQHAAR